MAGEKLPPLLGALLLASIISAVLSACNTVIAAISTNMVHDLVKGLFWPSVNEKTCQKLNIVFSIVVCIFGVTLAIAKSDILELLSLGYTFATAGCIVPFVGGILWKEGTPAGATASALTGIGVVLIDLIGIINIPFISITAMIPAAAMFAVVSLLSRPHKSGPYVGKG